MYTVYILHSLSLNRYYIGYTADVVSIRIQKHLSNHQGFTSKAKDWSVCYTEVFTIKEEATKRERQLKNWKSRQRIFELIHRSSTQ